MGFNVYSDKRQNFTLLSNTFISAYMPAANGNYIKIYLFLQMLCQHPDNHYGELTINTLADEMECTENDILRALRYWKKQGLLDWTDLDGEIHSIRMISADETSSAEGFPAASDGDALAAASPSASFPKRAAQNVVPLMQEIAPKPSYAVSDAISPEEPLTDEGYAAPEKQTYTPLQAEALRNDVEIDKAIRKVEELLGEPVSMSHLQLILYFMCDIGFSADLLITLYETALQKGKKKTSYIEAIGISWASKGILTPEDARAEASSFSGRYSVVCHTLGISDTLTPVAREIIDGWNEFGFSDEIIEEACRRTALQTGGGAKSLRYVTSIQKKWSKQKVHTLNDIEKSDESYHREKKNNAKKPSAGKNQFQNFPQRVYSNSEYSNLEKQLLNK
jgi:DnaD/phage-associated family protein